MTLETFLARTGVPLALIVFLFGAIVGSFLNVVIARLPYGESVVTPRSKCPSCETPIPGWYNIPILSYLLLRGKCASCKATIDQRYPTVELLTALLFVACLRRFGPTVAFLAGLLLISALIAITFIDIDLWEIPDQISVSGLIVGIILRPLAFEVPWYSGLIGAALGAGAFLLIRFAYFVWRNREGMGMGDIKLVAMIGAFLGPPALLPAIMIASLSGSIVGLVLRLVHKDEEDDGPEPQPEPEPPHPGLVWRFRWAFVRTFNLDPLPPGTDEDEEDDWVPPKTAVPFGPFLAIGAIAVLLFGPSFQRILFGVGLF